MTRRVLLPTAVPSLHVPKSVAQTKRPAVPELYLHRSAALAQTRRPAPGDLSRRELKSKRQLLKEDYYKTLPGIDIA